MRFLFTISTLLAFQCIANADTVKVRIEDQPEVKIRDREDVDWLRTNLVYVFDIARRHCQEDSESQWKPTQEEIRARIQTLKTGSYLELAFSVPSPITVEGKKFIMKKLWVRIRESDWATFDWMFETPEGKLVALSHIEGTENRKLGPIISSALEHQAKQDHTNQNE